MSSSPIRVGIIGLGKFSGHMTPDLWAAMAHLPYLIASPKYQITAVSNSTIESAQSSIAAHNLGPTVKAYGNPSDLANDPNVDMIIVCVRVAHHYALTKPALLAGKSTFVEWPLGANTPEAKELTQLAQTHGSKTIVGLQARASPLVLKLKSLISSAKIGKILSSTVISSFGGVPDNGWPVGAEYYLDINGGGNQFTIFFGHFLDSFTNVLGDFDSITSSSLRTDFPTANIVDPEGNVVQENYPKTAPDSIQIQGKLKNGAGVSIVYYTAPGKAVDGTGIRWLITGTEGQIEVTTPETQWQMGHPGTKLRVKIGKEGEVKDVDFELKDGEEEVVVKGVAFPAGNTARSYEAFVEGRGESFADFESAVKTHELLDLIRKEAGW
jgi:predicted dehydrogenase